jgi:hypothetical protein
MFKYLAVTAVATLMAACTSISVNKIDAAKYPIDRVCIQNNPAVLIDDLVPLLERELSKRSIVTSIYSGTAPAGCQYTLWYTALRGWDLVPYLRSVELRIMRDGVTVASASYAHGGGFDLSKFEGTEAKLKPMLDQLFADFSTRAKVAN